MAKKKKKQDEEEYMEFKLTPAVGFGRAASYLEEAGEVAINSRNIEAMLLIAKGWMELSDMLDSGQEPPKRGKMGFGPGEDDD